MSFPLMQLIFRLTSFALPPVLVLPIRCVKNILRKVQVSPTIGTRSCLSIKTDQPICLCGGICLPDIVKHSPFVEFGEIGLEVKIPQVLDISCVLCCPSVHIFRSFATSLGFLLGLPWYLLDQRGLAPSFALPCLLLTFQWTMIDILHINDTRPRL